MKISANGAEHIRVAVMTVTPLSCITSMEHCEVYLHWLMKPDIPCTVIYHGKPNPTTCLTIGYWLLKLLQSQMKCYL